MQVNPGDYSRLNVLLAGCGSIGKRHAEVLGALNVRRVTACDPDEAKWPAFLDVAPTAKKETGTRPTTDGSPHSPSSPIWRASWAPLSAD